MQVALLFTPVRFTAFFVPPARSITEMHTEKAESIQFSFFMSMETHFIAKNVCYDFGRSFGAEFCTRRHLLTLHQPGFRHFHPPICGYTCRIHGLHELSSKRDRSRGAIGGARNRPRRAMVHQFLLHPAKM